ncbi:MAG TPA: polysaccharide deacetylase family protein [Solirubrobacteraceae bacterium]
MGARRHIAVLAAAALLAGCGGAARTERTVPVTRTAIDASIAPVTTPQVPRGPHDAPVPILMYHVIDAAPPGAAEPGLWVPWGRFEREMGALAHAGFHAVTLATVHRAWHRRGSLPVHPIVISFDDGYQSQYDHARATLERLHWPGVLNLEVHNVDEKGGLSRGQVARMVRDGWELDAHTLTHPDLTTLDARSLRHEVAGSRRWLRRVFGVPVSFFAYPAGRYDATVEAAVRRAGYRGATTTQPGVASPREDPYALPRVRVMPEMTPAELVGLLRGMAHA